MKFRFCGDGDCPDWILAEIISTLSILTAKQLGSLTTLVINRIKGNTFEEDEIKSITNLLPGESSKSTVACIHFLVVNVVRYNVSESVFVEEIQQLGLPKELANAIGLAVTSNVNDIRTRIFNKKFKTNELFSIRAIPNVGNSTDCSRFEFIILDDKGEINTEVINIEIAQFKVMLNELKLARKLMQKYEMSI